MKDILIMLLEIIPKQMLFELLVESVEQHKLLNNKETEDKLKFHCMCYNMKDTVDERGMETVIKETAAMEGIARTMGLIKTNPEN
jgi:hypothetical protein